jgi:predicted DNA-binding transcriptional regulator YafY
MERLKEANPEAMTPIEAMALLAELRSLATGGPPEGAKAAARPAATSARAAKRAKGGKR